MDSSGGGPPQRDGLDLSQPTSGAGLSQPPPLEDTRRWRPSRVSLATLLLGVAATVILAATTLVLYHRNEDRLLRLRARELGLVLSSSVPTTQAPLASGAALAGVTGGDPARFRALLSPDVGTGGGQFASLSLWRIGTTSARPLTYVGATPKLTAAQAQTLFAPAAQSRQLKVIGLLDRPEPGLGYEFGTPGVKHGFAVYAERPLLKSRRSRLEGNSAFSDLDYAVYLGRTQDTGSLLVTSLSHLPIRGRRASYAVSFADTALTLVVTPRAALGGTFFESLPWIVLGIGVLISLLAALVADRLVRERQHAEQLAGALDRVAGENARMYTEQRGIAQTLQRALLPEKLTETAGLRASARYVPATSGVDVGGDWYDIIQLGHDRVLLVIGDVSGHGLPAATTMATLRHATLAYAADDARPAAVLGKLSDFVNLTRHTYFATVLCVMIDIRAHSMTIASAGHLPPLLIDGSTAGFVEVDVGVPIGVVREDAYVESNVEVPPRATLIAYTDGLVERRGELLDVGLQRLSTVATERELALDELLSAIPRELASDDHHDDTAIVGIQWTS